MTSGDAKGIGRKVLEELDDFLGSNYKELSSHGVSGIYDGLWNTLKKFAGHSQGFHGLTEFIILRVLYYSLGGSDAFTRDLKTSSLW